MNIEVFLTTWSKDGERLGALRYEVFVIEQKVPEELEWDIHDADAVHFACTDRTGEKIIATAGWFVRVLSLLSAGCASQNRIAGKR